MTTPAQQSPNGTEQVGIPCPQCGAGHSFFDTICSSCGMEFDKGRPQIAGDLERVPSTRERIVNVISYLASSVPDGYEPSPEDWAAYGAYQAAKDRADSVEMWTATTRHQAGKELSAEEWGAYEASKEAENKGGIGNHGGEREGAGRPSRILDHVDQILDEHANEFVVVYGGPVYAFNHRGLLVDMSRRNESALQLIADRLDDRATTYHLNEVRGSIQAHAHKADGVQIVPPTAINKRIPILPTETGGFDLRTGRQIDAADMRQHLQTERGYFFTPPPDPATVTRTPIVEAVQKLWAERMGRLGARWAAHLLNARPVIDVAVGESGAGKGTAISLLRRAFPGMVKVLPVQRAMGGQGRKWSVVEDALTEALVVIIDEADKTPDKPVDVGQVNSWVDGLLTRERKNENAESKPRLGTVTMVGGDYPSLPFDSQGMSRRFQAVYRLPGQDSDDFLSKQEWFWLNDSASEAEQLQAVTAFACLMVHECKRLAGSFDVLEATAGEAEAAERNRMFAEKKAADIAALQEYFSEDGTQIASVSHDRVAEVIQEATGRKPANQAIEKRLRVAFPDAVLFKRRQRGEDGKYVTRWYGVQE